MSRKGPMTIFRYAKYCLPSMKLKPYVLYSGCYTSSQPLGIRVQVEEEEELLHSLNY